MHSFDPSTRPDKAGTDPDVQAYFELCKMRVLSQETKDRDLTSIGSRLGVSAGVLFFYGLTIVRFGYIAASEQWAVDVLALGFLAAIVFAVLVAQPRKWSYPARLEEIAEDLERNQIPNAVLKKIADSMSQAVDANKPQLGLKQTLIKCLSVAIGVQVFCLFVLMDLVPQWFLAFFHI